MRSRLFLLLVLALVVVVAWGYLTRQLPFGLSRSLPPTTPFGVTAPAPAPGRSLAGQPAALGAVSYAVTAVERGQDPLAAGPAPEGTARASFVVLQLQVRNDGREPVTPGVGSFQLEDAQGRRYDADPEASRAAAAALKRRVPGTAVQPSSTLATALAFEVPTDATGLALRVTAGSARLELPER